MDNRQVAIQIGGQDYDLVLSTRATKEIAGRHGSLEQLGEELTKSENFEMAIDKVIWLITLLANQGIMIHNLRNPDDPKTLLTEEAVELLTAPYELAEYKTAISNALQRGLKRYVESEDAPSKNAEVG